MTFEERLGAGHRLGHPDCPRCPAGFPVSCACGGWIHGSDLLAWVDAAGADDEADDEADDDRPPLSCDRCGDASRVVPPVWVSGEPHAAGQRLCPGCPPGGPAACSCGGLVHVSSPGERRCERCGGDGS